MVTGGAGFVVGGAACPESLGAGCVAAAGGAGLAAWGADQTQAGWNTLWTGAPTRTFGGELVENALGVSPQGAELLYGALGGVDAIAADASLLSGASRLPLSGLAKDGAKVAKSRFIPAGKNGRIILPNGWATDMEAGGASQYDRFRLSDGTWNWPESNGAIAGTQWTHHLQVNQLVDRVGPTNGTYLAPIGSTLTSRSLAPGSATSYTQYRVAKSFQVEESEVKPAFSEMGHGIQFKISGMDGKRITVQDLIRDGYLEKIK